MPQRARQAMVVMMLLLYGAVSLRGLVGHESTDNHGSVSLPGLGLHESTDNGCFHKTDEGGDHGTGPKHNPDDCLICKFKAQGQMAAEMACVASRPNTAPHVPLIL